MESKNTYTTDLVCCRNCGAAMKSPIPRGTTLLKFAHSKLCDNCGCRIDGSDQVKRHTKYTCKNK